METYSYAKEQHRRIVIFGPKTRSLAVDYTDRLINNVIKIEIRYQSSSDTNMQSGTSTESLVAVPIDVRAWSSINKRKPTDMRKTGNFFSILSNILLSYIWIKCLCERERYIPIPLSGFFNGFTKFEKKWPLRTSKNRNSTINHNIFTPV